MSTLAPESSGILVVEPVSRDLGGFSVRRILPSAKRRTVGPFVFLDHMGPTIMRAGEGMDVRPHPHIGLATLTYLVEGRIRHRDTLGSVQDIEPGAVNWMTAGRGIAHSERTNDADRLAAHAAHGMQRPTPVSRITTRPACLAPRTAAQASASSRAAPSA
jgi:redox-sensitive bicupin YhaK (pirin superfamily)